MAASQKNPFSPGEDVHKHLEAVGQSALLIRSLMESIKGTTVSKEALKDAKISDLSTHLTKAHKLAEAWIDPISGDKNSPGQEKILQILDDFVQFNNTFDEYGGVILDAAKSNPKGLTGENLAMVHEIIGRLYETVGKAKQKSLDAQKVLKHFSDGLNEVQLQFQADKTKAQTILGSYEYQKTGAALFDVPLGEIASLDKGTVSEALKTLFTNNHCYTVDEVTVYSAGTKWGVASTSASGKTSGTTKGYKISAGYVIEKEGSTLKVYQGTGGKLLSLMAKYQSDQDAMTNDLSIIAGGAVGAVVGVLVICVGAIGDVVTGGAATGVILAGAAITVAGAGTAIYGGVDYSNKSKDASKTLQELANDEHLLVVLPHIGTVLDKLAGYASSATVAIDSLTTMWESVHSSLGNLKDSMDRLKSDKKYAGLIPSDVRTALKNWQDVAAKANIVSYNFTSLHILKLPHGVTINQYLADPEKYIDPSLIKQYHANAPAHA